MESGPPVLKVRVPRGWLRWVGLGLVACAGHCGPIAVLPQAGDDPIAGLPTTCDHRPATWRAQAVGRDQVRYAAGLEADRDRAVAGLTATREALSRLLGVSTDATPAVTLWLTTASPRIGTGRALTVSDHACATVYVYSPTCDPDPRPRQFEKTLLHELSGEYLEAATQARPAGWVFYQASPWFVQGLEEWVTLQVHDAPMDRVSAGRALALASPEGAIRVENGEVVVADPYRDGRALVGWIAATQGPDALTLLLASDAPTLDEALRAVLRLDEAGVVAAYVAWRTAGAPEGNEEQP